MIILITFQLGWSVILVDGARLPGLASDAPLGSPPALEELGAAITGEPQGRRDSKLVVDKTVLFHCDSRVAAEGESGLGSI